MMAKDIMLMCILGKNIMLGMPIRNMSNHDSQGIHFPFITRGLWVGNPSAGVKCDQSDTKDWLPLSSASLYLVFFILVFVFSSFYPHCHGMVAAPFGRYKRGRLASNLLLIFWGGRKEKPWSETFTCISWVTWHHGLQESQES